MASRNERFPLWHKHGESSDKDALLDRFLTYIGDQNLTLYPAQEEAILALFNGDNVILNTPTGSGKSLVALALHFLSSATGRRSWYTCPIKALVNEKFLALCRVFGPELVGMSTGDATVNGDAPIICCTAEILSNIVLREGASAAAHDIVMDEFHYYSDRERGVAWQVPLLVLDYSRFLLMSATIGDPEPFEKVLTGRTGRPTAIVRSSDRPVPLEFEYSETPLMQKLVNLVNNGRAPVYLVNFTQRECAEYAQSLLSLDLSSKEEKKQIAEVLKGEKFTSPYGKDLRKILAHGIGIHHAGLLPRYRLLVEKLAQKGLLKVIAGTDTLGVGVNVPIRSVLFTKLCKFDGEKTVILSVRDFKQISGRAGRKGFDDLGTVVVQAPEHVIENLQLMAKAGSDPKKQRQVKKKQAPQQGYVHWDKQTFDRLIQSDPETLRSSFQVSHGMLLNVLSRPENGCEAMQTLIRDCHESDVIKGRLRKQGFKLFRSLWERKLIELVPKSSGAGKSVRLNIALPDDFSIFQELAIWLLDTLPKLNAESPDLALDKISLIESICENPRVILLAQLNKLKGEKIGQLKSEGVDYDERMAIVEDLTWPKPLAEFIYQTFNEFQDKHPWLDTENIRPKSIARDMYEQYMSFHEYIREYGLQRSEGILLRYLSEVYKIMVQTIPESMHDPEFKDIIEFFRAIVRQVDSSLVDEWERIQSPDRAAAQPAAPAEEETRDITRSERGFTVLVRNGISRMLRALDRGRWSEFIDCISPEKPGGGSWNERDIEALMTPYFADHQAIRTDKESRAPDLLRIVKDEASWQLSQILTDPEAKNDWHLELTVDLIQSREQQDVCFRLLNISQFD
jgi:superfamily II RNA helicase